MTPLVPAFTGKSGSYPIELYGSGGSTSIAYLTTEDGGDDVAMEREYAGSPDADIQ